MLKERKLKTGYIEHFHYCESESSRLVRYLFYSLPYLHHKPTNYFRIEEESRPFEQNDILFRVVLKNAFDHS